MTVYFFQSPDVEACRLWLRERGYTGPNDFGVWTHESGKHAVIVKFGIWVVRSHNLAEE